MNSQPKHGQRIRLEDILFLESKIKALNTITPFAIIQTNSPILTNYDYLFKDIANDPTSKLPSTPETIKGLKDLGEKLIEKETESDTEIPAAYTYLGQFIDHDITLEASSDKFEDIKTDFFKPIDPIVAKDNIKNLRSATFDLDSLYQNAPTIGAQLKLGQTTSTGNIPPGKTNNNDLPRIGGQPQPDGSHRKALIGDHRNDENLIVSQLHLAFIKFHNQVQSKNNFTFEETQKVVRQHYQWIVINDFLKQICDNSVIDDILINGNKFYKPSETDFFIPLEFTVAAYRFGHSMVRSDYNFNLNFKEGGVLQNTKSTLDQLFQFTGLSGDFAGFSSLPENWIIEWENFLPFNKGINEKARKINTHLTHFLMKLPEGGTQPVMQSLAKRNLLRGYLLNLPIGQAIASEVLNTTDVLNPEQILNNANPEEREVLIANNFHNRTPLWYYILAEASIQQDGEKLGILGSRIVGETIVGLVRESADSILKENGWKPTLSQPFNLESLITIAGLSPA